MPWDDLLGHEAAIDRFRRSIERNRLASTYLFVGPLGVGKHTFALKLAQALLCSANPPEAVEACGNCPSCQQVAAKTASGSDLNFQASRQGVYSCRNVYRRPRTSTANGAVPRYWSQAIHGRT